MKRHEALRKLSSEHHTGLVLARKASKAFSADSTNQTRIELWAEIRHRFEQELEPHFREEESVLLPALNKVGEKALAERTLHEHKIMRQMVAESNTENLLKFARLLREHIRFEEQELFEVAQRLLTLDSLNFNQNNIGTN